jgi:amino acid transporter
MNQKRRTKTGHLEADAISPFSVLAIAIAAVSPTTSVFLVYGAGLATAGTGVVWAFALAGLIAVGMALSYAEVGSAFLSAGGTYTIVRRALGPIMGGVTALLFLVLGVVVTASILVAAATYLNSLVPSLPVNWTPFLMMTIITLLSLERISPTSVVTTFMLILELAVIVIFSIVAITHPAHHGTLILHPVMAQGHGTISKVNIHDVLVAVVPALFAYNGYDWPLYFSGGLCA